MHHSLAPPDTGPRTLGPAVGLLSDAVETLRTTLPPGWQVERIIDPDGELSVAVLAADDNPALPTFLLYARTLTAQIATIVDDAWVSTQPFSDWPKAVATLVSLATTAGGQPGDKGGALVAA